MFTERSLSDRLQTVRTAHAPDAIVLEAASDFETVAPAQAENLGLVVEGLEPDTADADWVPPAAPDALHRYASTDLTVGMPGDGSVAWTRQTTPPVVICKPRLAGTPGAFAEFLIAEALVEVGLEVPEHFLGLFEHRYPDFATACAGPLDPAETYQLAVACFDAYRGLLTREVFADWDGSLFDAWVDAGERLEPRLADLTTAVARGETSFTDAAELACGAVKHAGAVPAPFDALAASVYLDHGPDYAIEWAERTLTEVF